MSDLLVYYEGKPYKVIKRTNIVNPGECCLWWNDPDADGSSRFMEIWHNKEKTPYIGTHSKVVIVEPITFDDCDTCGAIPSMCDGLSK